MNHTHSIRLTLVALALLVGGLSLSGVSGQLALPHIPAARPETPKVDRGTILVRVRGAGGVELRGGQPILAAAADEGQARAAAAQASHDTGLPLKDEGIPGNRSFRFVVPPGADADAALARVRNHPRVESAFFDVLAGSVAYTPPDSLWPQQVTERKDHVDTAWDLYRGDSSVILGAVDSGNGRCGSHEFAGRFIDGGDLSGYNPQLGACVDYLYNGVGHGTSVLAEMGAAHNADVQPSMAGVCPGCRLLMVRVFGSINSVSMNLVAQGILRTDSLGAHVINVSITGPETMNYDIHFAVSTAQAHGKHVVGAAGNDNREMRVCRVTTVGEGDCPAGWAASLPVIAVGGLNQADQRAAFSNYNSTQNLGNGATLQVATASQAEGVITLGADGAYYGRNGTSFSAPRVSGAIGLRIARLGNLTPAQMRDEVKNLSRTVPVPEFGYRGAHVCQIVQGFSANGGTGNGATNRC